MIRGLFIRTFFTNESIKLQKQNIIKIQIRIASKTKLLIHDTNLAIIKTIHKHYHNFGDIYYSKMGSVKS